VTQSDDGSPGDGPVFGSWYANCFQVGQNAFEFKIDCGQDSPGDEVAIVYLRVITSPFNARELFRLLGVGLLRYADAFGPIDGTHGDGFTRST
jgi:hypothetical protein